jgi:hypothetical protein
MTPREITPFLLKRDEKTFLRKPFAFTGEYYHQTKKENSRQHMELVNGHLRKLTMRV